VKYLISYERIFPQRRWQENAASESALFPVWQSRQDGGEEEVGDRGQQRDPFESRGADRAEKEKRVIGEAEGEAHSKKNPGQTAPPFPIDRGKAKRGGRLPSDRVLGRLAVGRARLRWDILMLYRSKNSAKDRYK